jgi:hypothetical protein
MEYEMMVSPGPNVVVVHASPVDEVVVVIADSTDTGTSLAVVFGGVAVTTVVAEELVKTPVVGVVIALVVCFVVVVFHLVVLRDIVGNAKLVELI